MPKTAKSTKTSSTVLGIDYSGVKPFAFCGLAKWDINELAHLKERLDIIMAAVNEYGLHIEKVGKGTATSDYERQQIYEKATKTILEAGLVDFEYEKEANNPEAGPGLLGMLAGELKDFLRDGAQHGKRHVEMQLALIKGIS